MTDTTPRASIPLLSASQAQKHVTHNDALIELDTLLCCRILDRDLTSPPASPADGDAYLVHATGSGLWAGQDGNIAYCVDGAWRFAVPFEGLAVFVADESAMLVYHSGSWMDWIATLEFQNLPELGVNTTADATNKLAVKSNAILFDNLTASSGGTGDAQVKVNKETAGDTGTFLFQTGYSGRAEIGLAGDDDFHFKVSPDGSTWYGALTLARASGQAQFLTGSASAPSIAIGASNDGFYQVASHQLAAVVNGARVLDITANGIGRINNTAPLSFVMNNAEVARFDTSGNLLVGTTTALATLGVRGTTSDSTARALRARNSANAELFCVRNDGLVGIGTASPSYLLDMQTTASGNGLHCYSNSGLGYFTNLVAYNGDITGDSLFKVQSDNSTGTADRAQFAVSTNASPANHRYAMGVNTATQAGFIFTGYKSDGSTHMPLTFGTGKTTERARIDTNGNFGVGMASPSYKAHVNGTFGIAPGSSVTPANNGDVVFELTGNTTLTIRAKGSDGTVRSVALTLS